MKSYVLVVVALLALAFVSAMPRASSSMPPPPSPSVSPIQVVAEVHRYGILQNYGGGCGGTGYFEKFDLNPVGATPVAAIVVVTYDSALSDPQVTFDPCGTPVHPFRFVDAGYGATMGMAMFASLMAGGGIINVSISFVGGAGAFSDWGLALVGIANTGTFVDVMHSSNLSYTAELNLAHTLTTGQMAVVGIGTGGFYASAEAPWDVSTDAPYSHLYGMRGGLMGGSGLCAGYISTICQAGLILNETGSYVDWSVQTHGLLKQAWVEEAMVINPGMAADFTWGRGSLEPPTHISFDSTVIGSLGTVSYEWDFDVGFNPGANRSTVADPSWWYAAVTQSYCVELWVNTSSSQHAVAYHCGVDVTIPGGGGGGGANISRAFDAFWILVFIGICAVIVVGSWVFRERYL